MMEWGPLVPFVLLLLVLLLQAIAARLGKAAEEIETREAREARPGMRWPPEPAPRPGVPSKAPSTEAPPISLEEIPPRAISLEEIPSRHPVSLEEILPRPVALEEVPSPRAWRSPLRNPGDVRRGILLMTLLGTCRGLEPPGHLGEPSR